MMAEDNSTVAQKALVALTSFSCAMVALVLTFALAIPLFSHLATWLSFPETATGVFTLILMLVLPLVGVFAGLNLGAKAIGQSKSR